MSIKSLYAHACTRCHGAVAVDCEGDFQCVSCGCTFTLEIRGDRVVLVPPAVIAPVKRQYRHHTLATA